MKRILFLFFSLLIVFTNISTAETKKWKTYPIDGINATIKLPEGCYVFYDGMSDSGDSQKVFGIEHDRIIDFIKSQGSVLYVVFDDLTTELTLSILDTDTDATLNSLALIDLKDIADSLAVQYESIGAEILESSIYKCNGNNTVHLYVKTTNGKETDYRALNILSYSHGRKLLQFVLTSINTPISNEKLELYKEICSSVRYNGYIMQKDAWRSNIERFLTVHPSISVPYWKIAVILFIAWISIVLLSVPIRRNIRMDDWTKVMETKCFVRIANEIVYFLISLPLAYFFPFAPVLWIIRVFAVINGVVGIVIVLLSAFSGGFLFAIADILFVACSALMFAAI